LWVLTLPKTISNCRVDFFQFQTYYLCQRGYIRSPTVRRFSICTKCSTDGMNYSSSTTISVDSEVF
jgi:hypothetical protein